LADLNCPEEMQFDYERSREMTDKLKTLVLCLTVFFVVKWTEIQAVGGACNSSYHEFGFHPASFNLGDALSCSCNLKFVAQESQPFATLKEAREFAKAKEEEKPRLVYDFKIQRVEVKDVRP
jgi:hypothetical protein